MLIERELWDDNVNEAVEGEVYTHDGRSVHPVALVQRRWGWPRKAARAVVQAMKRADPGPVRLRLQRGEMLEQQRTILARNPEILDDILWGLSTGRARRNIDDMTPELGELRIVLSEAVNDDGITQGVLETLSSRFACTLEELRSATTFQTGIKTNFFVDVKGFLDE